MSFRKNLNGDPWWYTPHELQMIATEKATKKCELPPLLIQRIFITMARKKYPTRPRRAKKTWSEAVCVDDITYFLSCHIDLEEELIVVKNIRVPNKIRKKRKK